MVFFVFALQCMSTLAIARRETGSWYYPAVMWLHMFVLAYLLSLAVYQGGLALGIRCVNAGLVSVPRAPHFDGTPSHHKKLLLYETDHIPPRDEFIKETLDWLDRYLGPVQ